MLIMVIGNDPHEIKGLSYLGKEFGIKNLGKLGISLALRWLDPIKAFFYHKED